MSAISKEDGQKAIKLLKIMTTDINSTTECINKIIEDVTNDCYNIKKGISLLDLKNNTLLIYMANLAHTTLLKLSGKSIKGLPVIDRLIEDRVVIERLSPYENKLKYQIEKYIQDAKSAEAGVSNQESEETISAEKGMSVDDFNIGNETDDQEASDDEDGDDRGQRMTATIGDGKLTYRVPKVSQNKFVEENKVNEEEKAQAARRRLLNSDMMKDALYEHQDDPDVIYNSSSLQRKAIKKREEIKKFEEDNLTRVTISKKDRASMSSTYTAGTIHGELLGFSDVGVLDGSSKGESKGKKRGRKSSAGKNKKGKGSKKKKFR